VIIQGVGIHPGDYVYADQSGAAVIPASEVQEVLEGARAVVEEDVGYVEQIRDEAPGSPPQDVR
jgi:regulator of RNase E activity RraA